MSQTAHDHAEAITSIREDLRDFKEDLRDIKTAVQHLVADNSAHKSAVARTEEDVSKLMRTVHLGNGSPPMTVQLASIASSLDELNEKVEQIQDRHAQQDRNAQDVQKLKWVAYAKLAGAVALVVPGIVAFVTSVL